MRTFLISTVLLVILTSCDAQPNNSSASVQQEAIQIKSDTIKHNPEGNTIAMRFDPPQGAKRLLLDSNSFGNYLRYFPLQPVGNPVVLFDGSLKHTQAVHAAVLDIDVGTRDLQQCADAVMRLRAEYLWQQKRYNDIHFNFTNGFLADYANWRSGQRIAVTGNQVAWQTGHQADTSYAAFRKYLNMVFSYAGTQSLAQELGAVSLAGITLGDVFIKGGFPGHAVLVVDKTVNAETGETYVLLAQSYMPAQSIHILANPARPDLSPWYALSDLMTTIRTPEWTFNPDQLKRFE